MSEHDDRARADVLYDAVCEENGKLRRDLDMLRGLLDLRTHPTWTGAAVLPYEVSALGHGGAATVRASNAEHAATEYVAGRSTSRWMQPGVLLQVAPTGDRLSRSTGSVFEALIVAAMPVARVRLAYVPGLLPALPGELVERQTELAAIVAGARLRHGYGVDLVVLRTSEGPGLLSWVQVQSADGGPSHWIELERLCEEARLA